MEATPLVIKRLGYGGAKSGRKDEARKLLAKLEDESKSRSNSAIIYRHDLCRLGRKHQGLPGSRKLTRNGRVAR